MKRETIYMRVGVHPIQAKMWRGIQSGKIRSGMTLRAIGEVVGCKAPQQVKHHLETLRKLGAIDYIGGVYVLEKSK